MTGIGLNFSNGDSILLCQVSSFVSLGPNGVPSTVSRAIDGNLSTSTILGSTVGTNQRLRITVGGFPCGSNAIPTLTQWGKVFLLLIIISLGGMAVWKRMYRKKSWG